MPWQAYLCAWIAGLFAAPGGACAVAATAAGLALAWLLRGVLPSNVRRFFFALCFVGGVCVSFLASPLPPPEMPAWMAARERVRIQARVRAVDTRPGQRLRLVLSDVRVAPQSGTAERLDADLVWTWKNPEVVPHAGQRVDVRLRVKPVRNFSNPGAWDTEGYWLRRGAAYRAYSQGDAGAVFDDAAEPGVLDGARSALMRRVLGLMGLSFTSPVPVPEHAQGQGKAMLAALVFGERFFLEQETVERMGRASLAHSLALSGLHLGLVAGFGVFVALAVGWVRPGVYLVIPRPKLGVLCAAPPVAAYVWLGGPTPSLTRAAIMFGLWGVLLLANRDRVLIDGLFLALALMVLPDPQAVHDLGLQLSAVAVAGILLLHAAFGHLLDRSAEHVARPAWQRRVLAPVRGALSLLAISVGVNLAILPLAAYQFGYLSLAQWLNALWLPLLGFFVLPVGLAGTALAALPVAAWIPGTLLGWSAGALDFGLGRLARLDALGGLPMVVTLRPGWVAMLGYWVLLLALVRWWHGSRAGVRTEMLRPVAATALAGLVLLAAPSVWRTVAAGDGAVSLTLLDVGQGQAVCVAAGGGRWLVDGGGGWPGFDIGRAVVAPALAYRRAPRLAGAVMSHADRDHYPGLIYPLAHFGVGYFAHNGDWPDGPRGEELRAAIDRRGLRVEQWAAGDTIALAPGLRFDVLHPPRAKRPAHSNDRSLVLRLVQDTASGERGLALIPGDIELPGIETLLASGAALSAEVLVLPHHGSRHSLSPAFYARVAPRAALASAGFLNHFGFPKPEVRAALAARNIPLLSTSERGALTVRWPDPASSAEITTLR